MALACDTSESNCHCCQGEHFAHLTWPHPKIIFCLVFPALFVVELLLGGRIPKRMLICKKCRTEFMPCPACGTIHPGVCWNGTKGLGHWHGYTCPSCYAIIPCFWSLWSLLILGVTLPLWYFPVRFVAPFWLKLDQRRATRVGLAEQRLKALWLKQGTHS